MKQKLFKQLIGLFILSIFMFSCDNMLQMNFPEGPEGPAGKSAYEIWVERVNSGDIDWSKDRTTIEQFFLYLKGKDGKDGQDGKDGVDGLSAYELWVKEVEKGIQDPHNPGKEWDKNKTEVNDFWYFLTGADGKDGKNGSTPVIGDNGNWWIDGVDTGKPSKGADGKDGSVIEISNNNTWIIDGTDTGVPVHGKDGQDGKDGSIVTIGENGNWYIDGIDTTIPARGKDGANGSDGTNGKDGLSAYQVWVSEVLKGIDNPHNPGTEWDKNKISKDDFWYYLRGKAGVDGQNGQDGKDGSVVTIGNNGNWHIDGKDTGVPAEGKDGQDGKGDRVEIGKNDNWYINGIDTGIPAKGVDGNDGKDGQDGQPGRDGSVVTIGDNGNWHIDGEDTKVPAFAKDGQDGNNGNDGAAGLSAYELWKKEVATGQLDDPKNPGQKWPTGKDTIQNFWEYLTGKNGNDGQDGNDGNNGQDGKDGQSAYGLWKEEVAKGLENPHKPGTNWPKDQITVQDFWKYLRGKDGEDGKDGQDGSDGRPGEPGKPGESIILVKGVANVIAQYSMQEMSEYVRWTDGGVFYIVYNDIGQPSAGAEVSGLPGVQDPSKVYYADNTGAFIVPKEDLPQGKPISELVGKSTSVKYVKSNGETVTEASAENTYVPNKINIRLVPIRTCGLTAQDVNLPMKTQRHIGVAGADWEDMPMYFANMKQTFKAYELTDKNDPLSFDRSSKPAYNQQRELNNGLIMIPRPKIKAPYIKTMSGTEWDNKEHYYVAEMSSFYGETAMLNAVVQSVPIQHGPLINGIKNVSGFGEGLNAVATLTVTFDISHIDHRYFYEKCESTTRTINGVDYEYWSPVLATNVDNHKIFGIQFSYIPSGTGGIHSDNFKNRASINHPESDLLNVHVLSSASLTSAYPTLIIAPTSSIGTLEYDKVNKVLNFTGTKNNYIEVPDILNIPVAD